MRSVHLRGTALATFGVAAVLVVATVATPTMAGAATTTTVQVGQRVCQTATAGNSSCDAIRLVTRQVSTATAAKMRAEGVARPSKKIGYGPAGGYSPKQLAKAYHINPMAKTKQKVAIVDAFDNPSVRKDLNTWDHHYGIHKETKKSFKVVNQQGHASPLPAPNEGWAGEITLDVQSVRAVCRHCKIILVEADSNSNANLASAVDRAVKMGAKIVSNSYGGPESKGHHKDYAHKGVAILASSGDNGWYDWTGFNGGIAASDKASAPAVDPGVIGVGGTSLYLNSNASRASESVWNNNGIADLDGVAIANTFGGYLAGAAGSGCSTIYKANSWQKKAKGFGSLGCGKKASEVDVAALADPFTGFDIYETFNWAGDSGSNGWATYGGTSLSSPLIAGMWGLAGGPAKHAKHPELTLYNNWKKRKSVSHDVVEGGTGGCYLYAPKSCALYSWFSPNPNTTGAGKLDCAYNGSGKLEKHVGQCYAQTGYDGVSGVGTPNGLALFK